VYTVAISQLVVQPFLGYLAILFFLKIKRLRLSRGSVLAFSTQVRGFKPGRRIFKGEKKSSVRLPSEGK